MGGYAQFIKGQIIEGVPKPTTSFAGQTLIVTGANSGLGLEACKHLVRLHASRIVMAVRTVSKGEAAKAEILASSLTSSTTQIEIWPLDLTSYASVASFCDRAATALERLDHAILNAGVHLDNAYTAAEGLETTLTVNVVSMALMALLLLPTLRKSALAHGQTPGAPTPHISVTGSAVHFWANTKTLTSIPAGEKILRTLSEKDRAVMKERYYLSKLLVTLLVRQIAARIEKSAATAAAASDLSKPRVIINDVAPGLCRTDLFRHMDSAGMNVGLRVIGRSSEEGSRTLIWGVLGGKESQGAYMSEGVVKPVSMFAKGKEGQALGERLLGEVLEIAEGVRPGIATSV